MSGTCNVCCGPATQRCSGCLLVSYCGREHQRQDWKAQHRVQCRCYKVSSNAVLGRHLVATRAIRKGQIIFRESPCVVGPKIANVPLCLGCNRNLVPADGSSYCECRQCGWPICGRGCERSEHHVIECGVLASSGYRPTIQFDQKDPGRRESAYCVIVPLRALLLQRTNSARYDRVMQLESHLADRINTPLYSVVRSNLVPFIRSVLGLQEFSEHTIMETSAILDTNCFEIRIPEQNIKIRALYELGSMLSHDCRPNTKHHFDATLAMTLVASVDIASGTVIHASYTQPLLGTIHRRLAIWQAKCFNCTCNRCSDPTEYGTYIGALQCPRCRKAMVVARNQDQSDSVWKCEQRSCSYRLPVQEYRKRYDALLSELLQLDRNRVDGYEQFLERQRSQLHECHSIMLQAKYALTQLYGVAPEDLEDRKLQRSIALCRELLLVADQLEPGYGSFRGKLLVALEHGLRELGCRQQKDVDYKRPTVEDDNELQLIRDEIEQMSLTDPTINVTWITCAR